MCFRWPFSALANGARHLVVFLQTALYLHRSRAPLTDAVCLDGSYTAPAPRLSQSDQVQRDSISAGSAIPPRCLQGTPPQHERACVPVHALLHDIHYLGVLLLTLLWASSLFSLQQGIHLGSCSSMLDICCLFWNPSMLATS